MKVTLDLNSVVDFMLAESAVAAVLRRNGFSSNPPLLSFDHRHAIRRIALTAAATVVAVPELAAVVASLDLPSLPEVSGDDSGPCIITLTFKDDIFHDISSEVVAHYPLNIFSEISFYELSLYISYLQIFSFGLNTHEISRF